MPQIIFIFLDTRRNLTRPPPVTSSSPMKRRLSHRLNPKLNCPNQKERASRRPHHRRVVSPPPEISTHERPLRIYLKGQPSMHWMEHWKSRPPFGCGSKFAQNCKCTIRRNLVYRIEMSVGYNVTELDDKPINITAY